MSRRSTAACAGAVVAVAAAVVASTVADHVPGSRRAAAHAGPAQTVWQATWRAAPQPPLATGPSHDGLTNETVRMIVHTTVGGQAVRVRVSNAYGTQPLHLGAVTVAEQEQGPVTRAQHPVTFAGQQTVDVPAGAEAASDPVPLPTRGNENLAVSLYLPKATGPATWHTKAQSTTYLSNAGDWAAEPGGSPYQDITTSWFFLDGVDVLARPVRGTVVAFGDSITDGSYSTLDADATYPEQLARRLRDYAVLNEGIGGNEVLTDSPGGGAAAVHRFARDVLDQPGVTDVVFLEGVNDIGRDHASADQLIAAMKDLIEQAHARCLTVVGGTITPFANSVYDTDAHQQARETVNTWIRDSGAFDAVADFDQALRDPADPLVIDPRYHTVGDLHPNDRGYQVMAEVAAGALLKARPGCAPR